MSWFIICEIAGSLLDLLRRFTMNLLVNWWRNRWLNHIQKTVVSDNIKIEAISQPLTPCLVLRWKIQNRSELRVAISHISGDLYKEEWHFGAFDSDRLHQRELGTFCPPLITVTKTSLPKGDNSVSEVEVTLFPPLEFWLIADIDKCDIRNTKIKIKSYWGSVDTQLNNAIGIPIINIEEVAQSYRTKFTERFKSLTVKNEVK